MSTEGWELLAEPHRRAVFSYVRSSPEPVTRDDVAAHLAMGRKLAAHHLDRLAKAGLLDVSFARPPGRRGPGAGRPAKRYAAAEAEVVVSVPARRYDLVARIFAKALDSAEPRSTVHEVAFDEGVRVGSELGQPAGDAAAAIGSALTSLGYAPWRDGTCLRLANCPFHAVATVSRELTCGANLAFCRGLMHGLELPEPSVALDPLPDDQCCVRIDLAK